jgi:hypothetical protein
VYKFTVSHPFAKIAGDIWLLLIKLAGKMTLAERCLPRIRNSDSQALIEDFLDSAQRLLAKFKELLKKCEFFMLQAVKRGGSNKMGENAGMEFVACIFGRYRSLGQTEELMQQIRTWNVCFDADCEDVLR